MDTRQAQRRRPRNRRAEPRGLRVKAGTQPLQELEPDVIRELPASSCQSGQHSERFLRDKGAGHPHGLGPYCPDGVKMHLEPDARQEVP